MSKNHVFFRDLLIDTSTPLILFVPLKYFYSKYTIPVQSSVFKIQKKIKKNFFKNQKKKIIFFLTKKSKKIFFKFFDQKTVLDQKKFFD